jgi:hypothetical protein
MYFPLSYGDPLDTDIVYQTELRFFCRTKCMRQRTVICSVILSHQIYGIEYVILYGILVVTNV